MIGKIKTVFMVAALALSAFLFTGGSALAEERKYGGYCDLTIIKGVHTYDNRAHATGACSDQYVTGYFINSVFILDYGLVNIVEYDGQQFEISFPSKHVLLTVHIVEQGEMGWVQENGQWVYYNPTTGKKHIGWLYDGKAWYFLDSKGIMRTGWIYDNSSWYYLKPNGAMATGWIKDNNVWYYLKPNGAMATGWQYDNGKWYYLYSDGKMASNTKIGSYYVDKNGVWVK